VVSLDDPTWKPVLLFTNRRGRFRVDGLKSGRYELRMFTDPRAVIPFEIPEGQAGFYDLGTLRFPASVNLQ
jgi:outer membrane usher protein